jgi:hypothetical protein
MWSLFDENVAVPPRVGEPNLLTFLSESIDIVGLLRGKLPENITFALVVAA